MPNRPIGRTVITKFTPSTQDEIELISSPDFLAGLITDGDPANIPPNALQTLINGTYNRSLLFRRNGLALYSISKPDSLKVMAIFAFFQTATGINLLRFTATTINKATSTGWIAFSGPALIGTGLDYFSFTVADNRAFFSNGGQNVIMELLPGTNAWAVLGNAPKYKFLTSSFNRIIGANFVAATSIPYQIGWSGDLNYGEWNPLVDISAGFTSLVDSPADLSDEITGLFNLTSAMCITRQRSLWLATRQASATNPFFFFTAVPRIGGDCPRTIKLTPDGLFFYNFQLSSVYFYTPNSYSQAYGSGHPEDISGPIKRFLKSSIDDPANLFASFNLDTGKYTLFVASNTVQLVKAFTFDTNTKTWSYAEYSNISCVNDIDYASSTVTINGLTGITNNLSGIINNLGGLSANSNRFIGFNNGDLSLQPTYAGFPNEIGNINLADNGIPFTSRYDSKIIENPDLNTYITRCRLAFTPFTLGNVSLYYSKDDGNTFTLYKTVSITSNMLTKNQILTGSKFLNVRRFIWSFQTSNCMHTLNRFDMKITRDQNNQGPIPWR